MKAIRTGLAAGALGSALVLLATGCGSGGGDSSGAARLAAGPSQAGAVPAAAPAPAKPTVSAASLSIEPADGAKDVKPAGALKVGVAGGKLTTVSVTGPDGAEVPGTVAADGLSWVPNGNLAVSAQYKVAARATDANGLETAATSSFSTLTPAKQAGAHDNVSDNATYGVGMIVSLTFERPVKDKAAVEKGITFETSDGTVVKGHWFGSQRVDFRPAEYWKPGTKVNVHYRLKSVEVAPGVYGGVDRDEPFTIGRSQISTADVATHKMNVVRDGQEVDSVPFTAGKAGFDTWNGTMVIEDMAETTRMSSQGVAGVGSGEEYDISDVPHAMRLTDSGTYVHGNYWSSAFGSYNASHGCIGLADAKGGSASSRAGKFYTSSLIGDVVTVVNSKGKSVAADNGLSGWNLAWANW
ncbi:Ig-like domain-containing protein [Kitasatospora sp. NPDC094015]|uniref:L,D-transpeptidase n=1 Tax=Kitasatospora sp. NPDC094015 TaxID=3155205 RepID=UPI00332EFD4B